MDFQSLIGIGIPVAGLFGLWLGLTIGSYIVDKKANEDGNEDIPVAEDDDLCEANCQLKCALEENRHLKYELGKVTNENYVLRDALRKMNEVTTNALSPTTKRSAPADQCNHLPNCNGPCKKDA